MFLNTDNMYRYIIKMKINFYENKRQTFTEIKNFSSETLFVFNVKTLFFKLQVVFFCQLIRSRYYVLYIGIRTDVTNAAFAVPVNLFWMLWTGLFKKAKY